MMSGPGAFNTPPSGAASPSLSSTPSINRNLLIAVVLLALALTGLLAWTLGGKLLQKPGTSDPGKLVQAPGNSSPGALVQAPGISNPGPIVQAPSNPQPQPMVQAGSPPSNADIDDYLKFLKQIELTKMQLTKQQLASALAMYGTMTANEANAAQSDEDSKTFLPKLNEKNEDFAPQWNDLTAKFAARTPPQSCVDLRNKYLDYLGKIQGELAQIHDAVSKAESADPSGALKVLTQMQGTASADADSAAKLADDELANVCNQYHLSKDFTIQTDPSTYSGLLR
jgi:hypothetical protein